LALINDFQVAYSSRRSTSGLLGAVFYATGAIVDAVSSGLLERFAAIGLILISACRRALKAPGLSIFIVMTMAIAVGTNVSLDSTMTHLFLTELPFKDPSTLVSVWEANAANGSTRTALTYSDADAFRKNLRSGNLAFFKSEWVSIRGNGSNSQLYPGINVSGNFFDVLAIKPELGRLFTLDEDRASTPVAVISDELWRSAFGADPHVLGRVVKIGDLARTIIGVVPAQTRTPDSWNGGITTYWYYLPEKSQPQDHERAFRTIARLAQGQTRSALQSDCDRIILALSQRDSVAYAGITSRATTLAEEIFGNAVVVASALAIVVFLVLAIACANIANIFLARGSSRAGEIAIRYSLGASRRQIVGQLLIESSLYIVVGGLVGLAFAALSLPFLDSLVGSSHFSFVGPVVIDARMLGLALFFIVVAAILSGLAPALSLSRPDLSLELKRAGRSGSMGSGDRLRTALIASEVAATVAVVVIAGLSLRTLDVHVHSPMGFAANDRYLVGVYGLGPQITGTTNEQQVRLNESIVSTLASIPGSISAASSSAVPNWNGPTAKVTVQDEHYASGGEPNIEYNAVSAGYFSTMNVPILSGRGFAKQDRIGSAPVAVVNLAYARATFGKLANALGKRIVVDVDGTQESLSPRTIVGIVANTRSNVWRPFTPMVFLASSQVPIVVGQAFYILHANISPEVVANEVTKALTPLMPQAPKPTIRSLNELIEINIRLATDTDLILAILSGIALSLALSGVIAVVSYGVARRRNEIGIRLALGASKASVIMLVMRSLISPVMTGTAIGIALAALGSRALDGLLIERSLLSPFEEVVMVIVVIAFIFVAAYVPSRKAAALDPLVALRYE
jgi:putative ABC transport system permease protein